MSFRPGHAEHLDFSKAPQHVSGGYQSPVRQGGVEYIQMRKVWEETEQVDEGSEVIDATVNDEVPHGVSKVTKGGLKSKLALAEFSEVDFEDAQSFYASGVGGSFESVLILCFVRWRVTQPPNVRGQNFGSFFRDILAPPPEFRLVLKSDVMKQMALALREPRSRNKSAGFERSEEVTIG